MSLPADNLPWVLIPSYQPDDRLPGLVDALLQERAFGGVIVVNDGSSPDRAGIFESLGNMGGLAVLTHAVNRGKGQALKTGLNHYLLTAPPESPGIVCCDSGGQHNAKSVAKVAAAGAEAGALVLGVRTRQVGGQYRGSLASSAASFLFTLLSGSYLGDTQTGLRFIPRGEAGFFIGVPYDRFDYEFAALLKYASDKPGRLRRVPVETARLGASASRRRRSFRDSVAIGGVFVRFFSLSLSTAALDYLVFILALHFTRSILASFICARAASVIYNFSLSRSLVFKAKSNLVFQLLKYIGLVASFMLVSWWFTERLSGLLGGYVVLAKAMAEGGLFFLSFFIQKHLIFTRKNPDAREVA